MKHQPSTMSHNFSQVPHANVRRSSFDRSRSYKTTFNSGYLIPWMLDEILPGDTFKISPTFFARLATPLKPVMDNMWLDWFIFFIPNRLVWDNWQKQMGEQRNPGDSVDFLTPQMLSPVGGYAFESLQDYLNLKPGVTGYTHSALPLRAYNLVYNEWFRDENLQNSVTVDVGNGPDTPANYVLLRRGKRHDYFTSCLPDPQKGPAVTVPLGSSAPVQLIPHTESTNANLYKNASTGNTLNSVTMGTLGDGRISETTSNLPAVIDPNGRWEADLSLATASTINALRQAAAVQQLYETDARGGTRYIELIKAHFGVTSPDARLQRPEYLGGGTARVNVNPVAQTAPTLTGDTPQGNLAGFGMVTATGVVTKSFVEHGILLGMCSVRADLNYQDGLHRMWSRNTKLDYFWPTLQNIGEQAVLNKEIFLSGTPLSDEGVFGYQERYAEYRYAPNVITGKFRSNDPQSLDIWHLAQDFASLPTLNSTFIQENPPIERIVAVPSEPQFLLDVWTSVICARPMPMYSVPGLTRF